MNSNGSGFCELMYANETWKCKSDLWILILIQNIITPSTFELFKTEEETPPADAAADVAAEAHLGNWERARAKKE